MRYKTVVTYTNGDTEEFLTDYDPSNPPAHAEWMLFHWQGSPSVNVVIANVRKFEFSKIEEIV